MSNDSDPDIGNVLGVVAAGTFVGLYGTLTLNNNGAYSYALRSTDADIQGLQNGQTRTDTFNFAVTDNAPFERARIGSALTISITGVNDAPVLTQLITAKMATESVAFDFVIPLPTFTDADIADTLTYQATLANGDSLPTWLTFNA